MPSYKVETIYLKKIIKTYQVALANLNCELEGLDVSKEVDDKIVKALGETQDILDTWVTFHTMACNRTRGECNKYTEIPSSFSNDDIANYDPQDE